MAVALGLRQDRVDGTQHTQHSPAARRACVGCRQAPPSFPPHAPLLSGRLQGGPPRPVGMHSLDACLTHLAVAGRDSVVRLYSYE